MEDLIERLQDKDDKKAYEFSKEICAKSADSDAYYAFFNQFMSLLESESSYVRTRGFVLCCAQAKWDTEGKLCKALPSMARLLNDEKPTVVRQCLKALNGVVAYRPELVGLIKSEVGRIDLSKYKDSMSPLIKKDIGELLALC